MAPELDFRTYADWNRKQEGSVVQNGSHLPYDDATGKPVHKGDPIQGHLTVGYGHLVGQGEDFWGGVSEDQARTMHVNDLKEHARRAAAKVGVERFTELDKTAQIKLIEHEWNGGLDEYKDFTQAVLEGDDEGQLAHHKRYSITRDVNGNVVEKKPIARNEAWEALFYPEAAKIRNSAEAEAVRRADPGYQHKDAAEEGLGPRLFSSDAFLKMDPEKRVDWMGAKDPRFQALIDRDPEKARAMADEFAELGAMEDDASVLDSFAGGIELGAGIFLQTGANAVKILEDKGLIDTKVDDNLLAWANQLQISGHDQIGNDWYDQVAAIVGGVPGGILVPGAATVAALQALPVLGASAPVTALLAPILGYGTAGYVASRHEGPQKALKRAAIDASTSLLGPLGQHLPRAARVAMETSVNYALSVQDDPTKRGIEALSLGTLAGLPGKRPPFWAMQQAGIRPETFEGAAEALEDSRRAGNATKLMIDELEQPVPLGIFSQDGQRYDTIGAAMKAEGDAINRTAPYELPPQEMHDIDMVRFQNREQESMTEPRELEPATVGAPSSIEYAPGPGHVRAKPWGSEDELVAAQTEAPAASQGPTNAGAGPGNIGSWGHEARPEQRRRGFFAPKQKMAGEIINPFAKAFGFTVERGNVLPSRASGTGHQETGVLGWFWGTTREMKTFRRMNIQTVAHEAGHDLAHMQPELTRMISGPDLQADMTRMVTVLTQAAGQPVTGANGGINIGMIFQHQAALPRELRYIPELLSISYDRTSLSEGLSEFFRLYLTQDSFDVGGQRRTLQQHSPEVHRRVEAWRRALPKNQRNALRKFHDEAHAYVHEDAEMSIQRAVGKDENTNAALDSAATKLRQAQIDDVAGIENLFNQVRRPGEAVGDSFVAAFRQLRGVGAIMEGLIKRGAPRLIPDPNRPGRMKIDPDGASRALRDMLIPAGTTRAQREEAGRYILAWQSEELMRQGRESRLTVEQIEAGLAIADRRPELRAMARELNDLAHSVADFGETAGIFGAGDRARWGRERFIHSFMRDISDKIESGEGANIMTGQPGTTRLTGNSSRNLRKDWIELILDTHSRTIRLSMENIAKKQFIDTMLEPGRGGGRFIETLAPYSRSRGGRTIPEAVGNIEKPTGPDWMTVYEDGQPRYYRIKDPLAVQSLRMMHRPGPVFKLWNDLQSLKRGLVTIAPGFMAAAFAKDVGMHQMFSKTGGFALTKMLGGLRSTLLQDRHYRDFMMNGGGFSSLYGNSETTARDIMRYAQRMGMDPRYLLMTPRDLLKPLHYLSHALENAGRVAEHKAATRQNYPARHAVYMGREINGDYARRGEAQGMRFLSETIPFFGAMIVSHDKMFRAFTTDETHKAATALKVGAYALASMALYEYNRRYAPEYEEDEPDWSRYAFSHFYIPKYDENDNRMRDSKGRLANHHFTMPKLFEPGLIATMAELTAAELHKSNDADWGSLGLDIGGLALSSFGINVADRSFPVPLPIGVDMVVEGAFNKVLFTGNPIETLEMTGRSAYLRRKADTSELTKKFGETAHAVEERWGVPVPDWLESPAKSEALLRGFLGEWMTIAELLAEKSLNPDAPDPRRDAIPVISKFYREPDKYDRAENDFYDRYNQVDKLVTDMKLLRETAFTQEKREAYRAEVKEPANIVARGLEPSLDRTRAKLADIGKRIELIKLLPAEKMPTDVKTQKIQELIIQRRKIMSQTNRVAEQIERRYEKGR